MNTFKIEAQTACNIAQEMFAQYVQGSPTIENNPGLSKLAQEAQDAMMKVYQAIGEAE